MSDYYIFGLRPWGFHLTKILFHMGSSLLVLLMASTIISRHGEANTKTYKESVPFAAALLFATHPIHTEAVLGITEVSLAFFYLLSFYLYVRADVTGRGVPVSSVVFFFVAALSKETALTMLILLIAYDYSFKRDSVLSFKPGTFYPLVKRYLPYLVMAGIYLILRTNAIGGLIPSKAHAGLSGYKYFINVFPLFAQYLGKLILPVNLNAAYVFHPIHSLLEWKGIMAVAVTLCFILVLYLAKDRNRVVFFSLLLVVIPLLPAFYIPALGEHTFADRYLYLPSAGFVIIISSGLCGIASLDALRDRAVPIMLSVVLVITALYSAGTIKRNPVWKDSLTLWSDTVKKSPDSYGVHNNLGLAYSKKGMTDKAIENYKKAIILKPHVADAYNNLGNAFDKQGRMDKAIENYKKAIILRPHVAGAHNNLGNAYYKQGRTDEAIEEYKEALRLNPYYAKAHNNLGTAYGKMGLVDEAIEEYKEAINLNPGFADAHNNLGSTYAMQGRMDEAIEEFKEALRLKPDHVKAHYNLGTVYHSQNLTDEAIEEYKEALRLNPDYAKAHNNLGYAYADQGRTDEAIEEYRVASRLDPNFALPHYNLGNVYYENGLGEQAIIEYQEALRINPDNQEALYNLGTVYHHKGMLDEAINFYKKAIQLNSYYFSARSNLGVAYAEKGEYDKAIKELKEAIKLWPDAEEYYNLGVFYQRIGRNDMAKRAFENALKINTGFIQASDALKEFNMD
jgi:tetratricopeptide (TPR) repeat protein